MCKKGVWVLIVIVLAVFIAAWAGQASALCHHSTPQSLTDNWSRIPWLDVAE